MTISKIPEDILEACFAELANAISNHRCKHDYGRLQAALIKYDNIVCDPLREELKLKIYRD